MARPLKVILVNLNLVSRTHRNAIATHITLAVCFFHGRSHDLVRQWAMEDLIQRLREALERFREAAQATFMPRPVPVPIPVRVKR